MALGFAAFAGRAYSAWREGATDGHGWNTDFANDHPSVFNPCLSVAEILVHDTPLTQSDKKKALQFAQMDKTES